MATALTIHTARAESAAQRTFEPPSQAAKNTAAKAPAAISKDGWAKSEKFTFGDFLDVINPLQHLPVIGTLYRHFTGDEISSSSRIAGSTLFGGPIGFALGAANAFVDNLTGRDVGEHVLAFAGIGKEAGPARPNERSRPDMLAQSGRDRAIEAPSKTALPSGKVVDASELFRARPNLHSLPFVPSKMVAPSNPARSQMLLPQASLRSPSPTREKSNEEDKPVGQTLERLAPRAIPSALPAHLTSPQLPSQSVPDDFLMRLQSSMTAYDRSRPAR